jgi:aryl-alcohol dehydrogenase-like predicted oxidoreductase
MAWPVAQPEVTTVIASGSAVAQIEANAVAAGWCLTPEGLDRIDAALATHV